MRLLPTFTGVCLSACIVLAAASQVASASKATPPEPPRGNKAGVHKHLEDANFGAKRWASAPHFTKRVKRSGRQFNITYVTINGVNFSEPDVALSPKFIEQIEFQEAVSSQQHEASLLEGHVESLRPSAVDLDLLGVVYSEGGLWPCPIPFTVNGSFPSEHVSKIYKAVEHMEKLTRWRFEEISGSPSESQSDYIEFVHNTEGACWSYIGRQGGRQELHVSEWCGVGTTVHEILHAIGVFHEHTRSDRDDYVTIHFDNIESGWHVNYDISPWQTLVGSYDYGSIMHYPLGDQISLAQDLPEGTCVVGQRNGMSETDVLAAMSRWTPSAACGSNSEPPPYESFCNETTINVCGHIGINSDYMGHYLLQGVNDGRPYYKELDGTAFLFWRTDNLAWLLGNALGSNVASGYALDNVQTPDLIDAGEWHIWSGTAWEVSPAMTTRKCSTSSDAPSEPPTRLPTFAPTPLPTPLPTPSVTNIPTPLPTSYPTAETTHDATPALTSVSTPLSTSYPATEGSSETAPAVTSLPTPLPTSHPTSELAPTPTNTSSAAQGDPECFDPKAPEFEADQQWDCCSRLQPCPESVGHCQQDSDCQGNLVCGSGSCADIWGSDSPYDPTASCCEQLGFTIRGSIFSGARTAATAFGELRGLLSVVIASVYCFILQ